MDLCTQPTRTSSAQSISYSPSSSVTFRHFCDSKCQSAGSHLAPTHWFPWGSPVAAVIWTLYKWLADNVGSVCLRVFFFFVFFFWNVFLADKTTALWHSGGSWRSASAGQHFPARHRQQQDCGSQCLSGCSVMAMTEAKDPEIHVDVSLDFSLNIISSNQLSHRFTFAACFPVKRCCAAFSFYCDKVKIAKRWKIQEVRANINFSLNHGGAVWTQTLQ